MPADRPILTPRLVMGLFIVTLGTIFLLDDLHLVAARHLLQFVWPAGLFAMGVATVLRRWGQPGWWSGLIWICAGVGMLASELGWVQVGFWDLFWPCLLLILGASFVWRALRGPGAHCGARERADDVANLFAVMAGNEVHNSSQAFRGGDVSAFLGGCALDLREAQLADGEATIDVFAFWGGIEIKVPEDWRVESRVTVVMGGIEDKTRPRVGAARGRLVLRGMVVMGGVEVSN